MQSSFISEILALAWLGKVNTKALSVVGGIRWVLCNIPELAINFLTIEVLCQMHKDMHNLSQPPIERKKGRRVRLEVRRVVH